MNEALMRHAYGTEARRELNLDRPAAVLRSDLKPMREAGTVQWDLDITTIDFEQLKLGFRPQEMEDKWFIVATGPDKSSVTSVHILRSWTHAEMFTLHVKPAGDGGGARVASFTWEKALGSDGQIRVSERQAKKRAVFLCRVFANCTFEGLPQYDASIFWEDDDDEKEEKDKGTSA